MTVPMLPSTGNYHHGMIGNGRTGALTSERPGAENGDKPVRRAAWRGILIR